MRNLDKRFEGQLFSRRSFLWLSAFAAASYTLNWPNIYAHAKKITTKEKFSTVVIGAGLGGLSCAALLAKHGAPVTVIEQHDIPGGYATTFDRKHGKFRFDVSLHGTALHHNSAGEVLNELGIFNQLKMIALPELYHVKRKHKEFTYPQKSPDQFVKNLTQLFPGEEKNIRLFVHQMLGLVAEVNAFDKNGGLRSWTNLLLFPLRYPIMWKIRNKTLDQALTQFIQNSELKQALSAMWGYYGLPPSQLSAFYYMYATGGYLKNGSYHILPNSQALSDALVKVIEDHNGRIIYETAVEKIILKQNAVSSVQLSDGATIQSNTIVSNASAIATFNQLLPKKSVPDAFRKKLKTYQPSLSTFIVWLGLNQEIRGRIKHFSIAVSDDRSIETSYEDCLQGNIETIPFSVAIYDNIIEGYSQKGTSTLMIACLCGYQPWERFATAYEAGDKSSYYHEKNRWTDILIQRCEKEIIKNLSQMIEVTEASTPLTNQRYTGNDHGAIYGYAQNMNNAYMNRIKNRTPIKGLYLASAWGNPGGGYQAVIRSGGMTFQDILEDWN